MMRTEVEENISKAAVAVMVAFLAVLAAALMICFQILVEGFLIRDCWRWLVLPTFPNLPALDWKAGASLSLMWHAFAFRTEYPQKRTPKESALRFVYHFFGCVLIYATAYFIYRCL
jgi:hypothetical protein